MAAAAMVRKSVLRPLLVAAAFLVLVGFELVVVPLAFAVPCPEPEPQEEGGLGSSPAPSPGSGSCEEADACVCLRVSFFTVLAVSCVITGEACSHCYDWLVNGEEEEAAGEVKKAGYVAIAGDFEVAGGGGKY